MDADSSTKFIGSLTKFLQSLCNGYVEFQRGVELVGHIYLNIDTGEKVDYVLHEKVSKNDENSVTFVSNSFHALPKENDKGKTDASAAKASKSQASSEDDDDDIVILDQPDKVVGSTNSGTVPSRGVKRAYSGSSDHRKGFSSHHGNSSLRSPPWSHRQQSGPAATATSQGTPQQNLSMTEVKLEQLSSDELLSLASQVDEGGSSSQGRPGGGGRSDHAAFSSNDAQGQPWVKQEPMDEAQGLDTGWSQSDSSNSGSNLYPVMMHANSGAYTSSPMGSGFPSSSGSVSSHRGLPHSFPGMSGAASPYGHPMPGTSHDTAGMDPSVLWRLKNREKNRSYWQQVKSNPHRHEQRKMSAREGMRRLRARRKAQYYQLVLRMNAANETSSSTQKTEQSFSSVDVGSNAGTSSWPREQDEN